MKEEGGTQNPVKDFGWLALFLIVLGVIWFAQGGPAKLTSMTSPFLQSPEITPSPNPSQDTYGSWKNPSETINQLPKTESPYKGKISLNASWPAKETDPQKEYIEISAYYSNKERIPVTGWTLKGKQGLGIAIGKGANLVYSAQVNTQDIIFLGPDEHFLGPNDRAIIVTGHSPIGTSFRLNLCTGYFNQFQDFIPPLPQECPRVPAEEIPINYPDACADFVKSLPACKMPLNAVPPAAGNDCINFVNQKASYNGCVSMYKNRDDFYKPEWRIYLGRDHELWGTRDVITLFDNEGKIVDQVSY